MTTIDSAFLADFWRLCIKLQLVSEFFYPAFEISFVFFTFCYEPFRPFCSTDCHCQCAPPPPLPLLCIFVVVFIVVSWVRLSKWWNIRYMRLFGLPVMSTVVAVAAKRSPGGSTACDDLTGEALVCKMAVSWGNLLIVWISGAENLPKCMQKRKSKNKKT